MNNINRGNNRRRGRGGNRQQGGGQPVNRIDSRARGNAPQLLEKYRKMAHDAHLNGDRVQEETYLQFADHYFRVLADQRQRQEEQRKQRQRWQEGGEQGPWREDGEDQGGDDAAEGDYQAYDQQQPYRRQERDEGYRDDRNSRGEQNPRNDRNDRNERNQRDERPRETSRGDDAPGDGDGEDTAAGFETGENPFVRESRGTPRPPRPRREERRPRQPRPSAGGNRDDAPAQESLGLDPTSLPPSISAVGEPAVPDSDSTEEKPRRRTRRPRAAADDSGEALNTAT